MTFENPDWVANDFGGPIFWIFYFQNSPPIWDISRVNFFFFKISRLSMSSKSSLSLCPTKHKNDFTKNMNSVPMCYGKPGGKGIKFLVQFGEPLVWRLTNVLS